MKKTLRILSLLLALVFVLSLAPLGAFAEDNNTNIDENPAGHTYDTNYAEIGTNNGTVTCNAQGATIDTNNGYIGNAQDQYGDDQGNAGYVTTNNGTVTVNEGTVTTNAAAPEGELVGGVVLVNAGTVETNATGALVNENYDSVRYNYGTVGYNGENSIIGFNYDTVSINDGKISDNYGTVEINNDEIHTCAKNNSKVGINNGTIFQLNHGPTVTTNNGEITYNIGGTVTTNNKTIGDNESGVVTTNNGEITTNNSAVETNNGTVGTNNGYVTTNNGTVGTNNIWVKINTGTVNDNQGRVRYNAGGEIKDGNAAEKDGWGLKVEGADNAEVDGTGVVTEGNVSFVLKNTDDLTVSVKQQDGYKLNVDAGGTGFTTAAEGGSWKVSFGAVLNNLRVFLSKLAAPAGIVEDRSGLDAQYMAFIYAVVEKIGQAPENGTVEIDAGAWRSFRREVFQALALRPDVTLVTTYKGENGLMRFTVPAGADVLGLLGGKAVIEFAALAALLAVTPAEADMKLTPRG